MLVTLTNKLDLTSTKLFTLTTFFFSCHEIILCLLLQGYPLSLSVRRQEENLYEEMNVKNKGTKQPSDTNGELYKDNTKLLLLRQELI